MTIVITTSAPRPVLHQKADVVRVAVDIASSIITVVHVDVGRSLPTTNRECAVCGDSAGKVGSTFNAQPIAIHRAVEVGVAPLGGGGAYVKSISGIRLKMTG